MRFWSVIVLLVLAVPTLAQFEEPTAIDTVRSDSLSSWADTSVTFADSAAIPPASAGRAWLFPLAIVAATCLGFVMLFTTRSR